MSITLNASQFSYSYSPPPITSNIIVHIDTTNNTPSVNIYSNTTIDPRPSGNQFDISYNSQCFWSQLNTNNTIPISEQNIQGLLDGSYNIQTITASQLNSMGNVLGYPGRFFIGQPLIMLYYSNQTFINYFGVLTYLPNEFLLPPGPGYSNNSYGGIQISISFVVQPCGIPTNLTATSSQNSQVPLTWTAPSDDGGSAITNYLIQYNTTGTAPWNQINTGSSSTSYTITGLTNGTTYFFQVAAANGYCDSDDSEFIVAVGQGPNKIAYSHDGISWTGLGDIIFDISGYSVSSNGTMWIAVGKLSNTIAYSNNGINWTGLGNSILTDGGYDVAWNGSMWVAVGQGSNTIAYSNNGINWTGLGNSIFEYAGLGIAWNGTMWIAVGTSPSFIAYSYNGTTWTQTGVNINNNVNKIASNGTMWVAVAQQGANTILYSNDGINNWTGLGNSIFTDTGYDVAYNGSMWVAVGSGTNTIAYSNDGVSWNAVTNSSSFFSSGGVGITWSGNKWVAVGETTNTIAYSYNGTTWTNVTNSTNIFGSLGRGVYAITPTSGPTSGLFSTTSTATPATIPDAPTNLTTAAGISSISVAWNIPSSDGGAAISSYTLQYRSSVSPPTPPPPWNTITGISPTPTPHWIITGLPPGTYDIQVAALNAAGTGTYSAIVTGTTDTTPDNPTNLQGVHGNQQVSLSWNAPINDGGSSITSYLVEYKLDASGSWTPINTGSTSLTYIVGPTSSPTPYPLTNGTLYDFRVSAINVVGTGSHSNIINVTPSTIPGAPVITPSTTTCDNKQSVVTWSAPVDTGGAPILSYNLQYSTISTGPWLPATPYSVTAPTTTYTFTGLTNGTRYYFQVQAVNINGPGSYSIQTSDSTAIPSITPQAPSPITTTPITSSTIALSWTAPTNTGGNPITGYLIYWAAVSSTGSIIPPINSYTISGAPPATTYTISGLTHATLYEVYISSINCSGVGPVSSPPLYITTSSITPSAPTNLSISGCNTGYTNSVILTWTAPVDDGGSPITNYVIYYRTSSVGIWYTYDTTSDATTAIITLPSSSTSYDFKVAAQNIAGVGIFSSPIVTSSSYNPPTAPTNLVATNFVSTNSLNGSIILTWTASTQEAPQTISYYVVEYKICEFGGWITYPSTITPPSTSIILSNLGPSSNIANNLPYLFRVYAVNSCGAKSDPSNIVNATSYNNDAPTRLWSRFNLNCSGNITSFDNLTRNMLRKAQVLQYPAVGTLQFSRASLWSMAANNQLTRQKAWASQSQEYTYPNITNINNEPGVGLKQTPTSLVCWTPPPSVICNSSTASDVPGTPTTLCFSKNAPFDNFRRPITYSSGGTKWPVFFSK